jgi:hypothetical protein
MADLSREEFLSHIGLLHDGIKGVHERLDTLNGRTRHVEQLVAVHEDRLESQHQDAKVYTRKAVGLVGALVALIGALAQFLQHLWLPSVRP